MQVKTVQPSLKSIPPAFQLWVWNAIQPVLPFWLRHCRRISQIQTEDIEHLAECYEQFQLGKTRLLIAFRHPTIDDPPCLLCLMNYLLPKVALHYNIRLKPPVHVHFVYDRGIPPWLESVAAWLFSRLGATPIQRGKLDQVRMTIGNAISVLERWNAYRANRALSVIALTHDLQTALENLIIPSLQEPIEVSVVSTS